jgi:RimJ/RimL family protein N-acetyltransferase
VLETERLRLRPLTEVDGAAYAALVGDPDVMRFVGGPVDRAGALRQLASLAARTEADGLGVLAAERRTDGAFLGRAGFWIWKRSDWTGGWSWRELGDQAEIELGWMLAPTAWHQGYATEAARKLLRHAFDELGLARVISLIDPRNTASLRVAERLGAVREPDISAPRWGRLRLYRHVPPGL